MPTYDENKLTKLGALKKLAQHIKDGYVTQENFNELQIKLAVLEETVPKKTSELENDVGFKDEIGVQNMIDAGIDKFKTDVTNDDIINTFKEIVDYIAEHGEESVEILQNISNLKSLVGTESVSTQITTALKNYIQKDGDKVLSTNDYTNEDKQKVDTISYASDEEVNAMLKEVFSTTE